MDSNELKIRTEACDDFIKLLSMVMGRLSLSIGTKLSDDDKKAFTDFLMENRKILLEKYRRGG